MLLIIDMVINDYVIEMVIKLLLALIGLILTWLLSYY